MWYLATVTPIRVVADRFNVTESCVYNVTRRVCKAIADRSNEFIIWHVGNRMKRVVASFHEMKRIPGVIGLIDGTHIRFLKPKEDPDSYINRKKYHSILLQGICDHELLFTNINCGYPGSVHDGRVLRNSQIFQATENARNQNIFPNGTYLLGDAAYPCLDWLITPFKDLGSK